MRYLVSNLATLSIEVAIQYLLVFEVMYFIERTCTFIEIGTQCEFE